MVRVSVALLLAGVKNCGATTTSRESGALFHERPTQWPAFRKKYLEELAEPTAMAALEQLYEIAESAATITLIYSSSNETHNNAVVLKELLAGVKKPPSSTGPSKAAAVPSRARGRR